ncbi:hypothetical protein EVAR_89567_1 [Eumeta japonica]|uniref:Uncharacterized protein n=1 Tax=Eumeta variegata TaxID=151549 RepID=A0A4C1YSU3_EUMVA|nr:hypothetical protein EVAR_89567_1 [Eumeta japonica]
MAKRTENFNAALGPRRAAPPGLGENVAVLVFSVMPGRIRRKLIFESYIFLYSVLPGDGQIFLQNSDYILPNYESIGGGAPVVGGPHVPARPPPTSKRPPIGSDLVVNKPVALFSKRYVN